MTKASPNVPSGTDKDLRTELCQRIAAGSELGAYGFQFRIIMQRSDPQEAWVYLYQEHQWQKRDDLAFDPHTAPGLLELLEAVAKRTVADDWSCRRIEHPDRIDFELKFRRESLEEHRQHDLESFIMGLLFVGHHDSGLDARRRIRFQGR